MFELKRIEMLIFLLIYLLLLRVLFESPSSRVEPEVATNFDNVRKAQSENIRKYMNESANPCDNFYDFACGNWKTYYPANSSITQTRSISLFHRDFEEKLYKLLNSKDELDSKIESKVKTFYFSCMRTATFDVKDKLKEISDEFDQGNSFDWLKSVAEISYRYGINIILGYSIKPNARDHTSNLLLLSNPEFISNIDQFRYDCEMIMVEYLGLPPQTARSMSWEIADFESILWQVSRYNGKQPERGTVDQIHYKYAPDLNIRRLLNISLGYVPMDLLWVEHPTYLENLIDIMKGTPKKVIANYISIRLLYHFWRDVSQYPPGLAESCIRSSKANFPKVLSYMFYRSNKLSEKKKYVENLWHQLRETLKLDLESNKLRWIGDNTRQYALEKLHSMTLKVATYEENRFDEEYGRLEISPHDYIENLKKLKAFNAMATRASLHKKPQHADKALDLQTPVYVISSNSIIVPVSVLQSDFLWSDSNPNVVNLAHLGFCISHEILHGFSGEGRNYDKLGNFYKWWDKGAENEYAKRRKCFHDQYHNYTYGGVQLPQHKKQDENVADNAGIVLAYETFRRWSQSSGRTKEELASEVLPHLNYTSEQIFFISYSQLWCADTLDSERVRLAAADVHAPNELRAFVPLTNYAEFSKVFKCPKGSPMNPVNKCKFYN